MFKVIQYSRYQRVYDTADLAFECFAPRTRIAGAPRGLDSGSGMRGAACDLADTTLLATRHGAALRVVTGSWAKQGATARGFAIITVCSRELELEHAAIRS